MCGGCNSSTMEDRKRPLSIPTNPAVHLGGKIGPWQGEARLMDMKAHMEKAKASGA